MTYFFFLTKYQIERLLIIFIDLFSYVFVNQIISYDMQFIELLLFRRNFEFAMNITFNADMEISISNII